MKREEKRGKREQSSCWLRNEEKTKPVRSLPILVCAPKIGITVRNQESKNTLPIQGEKIPGGDVWRLDEFQERF